MIVNGMTLDQRQLNVMSVLAMELKIKSVETATKLCQKQILLIRCGSDGSTRDGATLVRKKKRGVRHEGHGFASTENVNSGSRSQSFQCIPLNGKTKVLRQLNDAILV